MKIPDSNNLEDSIEVITRWGKMLKPIEEISVDGGKTWWTKEQYRNLTALITKEKIKELERLANEPSTPPDCPKECKSKHWHHVVVGNIKYRISELKQQLGGNSDE